MAGGHGGTTGPRQHRRAVGPRGAHPPGPEPGPEPGADPGHEDGPTWNDPADDERFLVERPPHHEPRD